MEGSIYKKYIMLLLFRDKIKKLERLKLVLEINWGIKEVCKFFT